MEKSYKALRDKGTDLDNCENWQIKDFFEVSPCHIPTARTTLITDPLPACWIEGIVGFRP